MNIFTRQDPETGFVHSVLTVPEVPELVTFGVGDPMTDQSIAASYRDGRWTSVSIFSQGRLEDMPLGPIDGLSVEDGCQVMEDVLAMAVLLGMLGDLSGE